ncbi:hypothetical protein ACJX0J_029406, partial [Zea mays]
MSSKHDKWAYLENNVVFKILYFFPIQRLVYFYNIFTTKVFNTYSKIVVTLNFICLYFKKAVLLTHTMTLLVIKIIHIQHKTTLSNYIWTSRTINYYVRPLFQPIGNPSD